MSKLSYLGKWSEPRENARARAPRGFAARSHVFARLASLAQIGELARRLKSNLTCNIYILFMATSLTRTREFVPTVLQPCSLAFKNAYTSLRSNHKPNEGYLLKSSHHIAYSLRLMKNRSVEVLEEILSTRISLWSTFLFPLWKTKNSLETNKQKKYLPWKLTSLRATGRGFSRLLLTRPRLLS